MKADKARKGSAPRDRPRRVTILGSTGSVGCNTVELIEASPDDYAVEALVAHRNAELLARQARRLKAKFAVVSDESQYRVLKEALSGSGIEAASGIQAVVEAALVSGRLGDGGDRRLGGPRAHAGGGAARRAGRARQ